jgi:hypothetical protein
LLTYSTLRRVLFIFQGQSGEKSGRVSPPVPLLVDGKTSEWRHKTRATAT